MIDDKSFNRFTERVNQIVYDAFDHSAKRVIVDDSFSVSCNNVT